MVTFELGILRTRMLDAARAKARRGELRYTPPIGYLWDRDAGIMFDPDVRIQEVTLRRQNGISSSKSMVGFFGAVSSVGRLGVSGSLWDTFSLRLSSIVI